MIKIIKDFSTKVRTLLSENVIFLMIMVLFLPDYLLYPAVIVAGIFVLYEWIRYKGYKWSLFWILWAYLLIVAVLNKNMQGIMGTMYLIILVAYAFVLNRRMSPKEYMKMQYYIVWCSLFNFFFNFIRWRPFWYKSFMSLFDGVIQMGHLPFYGDGYFRAYSTFDNPNLYAFVLLIVLLVCFNQLQFQITFKNYRLGAFYAGAFIINLYAMFLTGTRSIIVALMFGLLTVILVQRKWTQFKVMILLGALLTLFILSRPDLFPRFMQIAEHSGIRLEIWDKAIHQILKEPWFGKGMFTYALLFDNIDAHNIFIESFLSFGICGTIILVSFLIGKLRDVYLNAYYLDYPLALGVLVATIMYGIFDIPLFAVQTSLLFVAVFCLPRRQPSQILVPKPTHIEIIEKT
ncbi:O-antigen ligase family protein [Erysipelothrix rhusiopathiae]|nr:O-antigen ligase family protein [Erysipelothrix rhusiopathiae]MDE8041415.1 O-antigen ligase family protein [Erysipelothrix rhusiopathiae]MDE8044161.1 O-antigen ligase family protein [Erysipelothrix rhusiopathiae]MDE8049961.1 O-antigen ligase family protein [Erysipelothrix rhusiopathiae]MDE8058284.1 O-antigen ligase family protein [Erysipelothrix rhusiopathiae]